MQMRGGLREPGVWAEERFEQYPSVAGTGAPGHSRLSWRKGFRPVPGLREADKQDPGIRMPSGDGPVTSVKGSPFFQEKQVGFRPLAEPPLFSGP